MNTVMSNVELCRLQNTNSLSADLILNFFQQIRIDITEKFGYILHAQRKCRQIEKQFNFSCLRQKLRQDTLDKIKYLIIGKSTL